MGGFDVAVLPLTEIGSPVDGPPLTLANAASDATSYTFGLGTAPPAAEVGPYGNWGIRLTAQPSGTSGYVISGDAVRSTDGSLYGFAVSADAPGAALAVYAFGGEAVTPPQPEAPTPAPPSSDQPLAEQAAIRVARLYAGDCDALGDVVAELTDVALPVGDPVGQATAIQVEESRSTAAVSLDNAIDGGNAVAVFAATPDPSALVACGEIGGVNDHDGAIVIGLREMNGSGLSGIAVLAYNALDPATTTDVSIFLAQGLVPAATQPTSSPTPTPSPTLSPTVAPA
jgi:hypothetical protein